MNENDVLFKKVTQAYSEKRKKVYFHHIYFMYHTFDIQILAVCRMLVP